ncbi:MAG: hypothetical protein HKN78_13210 [Sphingomonadaceae bacterium]|nr:hypothetical protein [Sphingomonadaceae bacterium]
MTLAIATGVLIACASPDETAQEQSENLRAEDARQQQLVEDSVRRAYEDEGADVVELDMRRSEDGSEYTGRARVRDRENGEELVVDCRVSADARGAAQLECNRANETAAGDS